MRSRSRKLPGRRRRERPNPTALRLPDDVRVLLPLLAAHREQPMVVVVSELVRADARARGIEVAA